MNGLEVQHTFRGRWIPSKILPKIPVKFFYQQTILKTTLKNEPLKSNTNDHTECS